MNSRMTDACTREGAERMEAEEAEAALPSEIAEALADYTEVVSTCWNTGDEVPARAALVAAILADRERLAAESEARRLVLVLKATELRQEWLRAERAEEALRLVVANVGACETANLGAPCSARYPSSADCWCAWCVATAALASLPAPQPAPEVTP